MNFNIINLDCSKWSKDDWRYAYNQYCQHNMFGPKTKREYYDMVHKNFRKLTEQNKPLSDELKQQWLKGWRNAVAWARHHGCDMNGRLLADVAPKDAIAIAERAEEIAIDTAEKMSYYEGVKGRKTKWRNH